MRLLPIRFAAKTHRAVGVWLLGVAALVALMVIVGGLTRLTDSGLSITEWRPVTGAIPPMSDADWQSEFAKYQASSEYRLQNRGMSLDAFKTIYWWEWGHRFLGRLIGAAFLIPFLVFLFRGMIARPLVPRLVALFVLGGAQGALGWWMVRSGLADRIDVSQYRLAAHLALAFGLFGLLLWTGFEVLGVRRSRTPALGRAAMAFLVLVSVQIVLGAFVAGLDAGHAFDSWPGHGGYLLPPGLYELSPAWTNHFENPALAHIQHRLIGYAVVFAALWLAVSSLVRGNAGKPARIAAVHVAAFAILQALLGILTAVWQVPIAMAAAHQAGALALFGASVWLVYVLTPATSSFEARLLPRTSG